MDLQRWQSRLRRKVATLASSVGYSPNVLCVISGAPRSGTTAVVKWLQTNKRVSTFAETRILVAAHAMVREAHRFQQLSGKDLYLRRAVRRLVFGFYAEQCKYAGRPILVDKEPLEPIAFPDRQYEDFLHSVRFIEPDAKIIFMVREPIGTVWSMSQRKWGYSLTEGEPRTFTLEEHVANWCACADIALEWASDPNVYVCFYDRLVTAPESESMRIAHFLGLGKVGTFEPKQSSEPGFSPDQRAFIAAQTQSRVEALAAVGVAEVMRAASPSPEHSVAGVTAPGRPVSDGEAAELGGPNGGGSGEAAKAAHPFGV